MLACHEKWNVVDDSVDAEGSKAGEKGAVANRQYYREAFFEDPSVGNWQISHPVPSFFQIEECLVNAYEHEYVGF